MHFSFCVWRQSKSLAHIHEARVNREGSILSPLTRSSLVSLGTGTVTSNSPFCNASRVLSSGISLSWSCLKGTQISLQFNGWLQQPALIPARSLNEPTSCFSDVFQNISDISYCKYKSSDGVCTDITLFIYILQSKQLLKARIKLLHIHK